MSIKLMMPSNHLFSIMAIPIYIPTNNRGRFPFLHTLSSISVQFTSVAQLFPSLCNPMDCSMPCFSVNHQHPELAQTHVYRVGDAIQPSHPLSSPSPPALNLSQHQGLSQGVSSLHQVAKVLEFHLQHESFK